MDRDLVDFRGDPFWTPSGTPLGHHVRVPDILGAVSGDTGSSPLIGAPKGPKTGPKKDPKMGSWAVDA